MDTRRWAVKLTSLVEVILYLPAFLYSGFFQRRQGLLTAFLNLDQVYDKMKLFLFIVYCINKTKQHHQRKPKGKSCKIVSRICVCWESSRICFQECFYRQLACSIHIELSNFANVDWKVDLNRYDFSRTMIFVKFCF